MSDGQVRVDRKFGPGSAPVSVVLSLTVDHMRQAILQHLTQAQIPELDSMIESAINEAMRPEKFRAMIQDACEKSVAESIHYGISDALYDPQFKEALQKKVAQAMKESLEMKLPALQATGGRT